MATKITQQRLSKCEANILLQLIENHEKEMQETTQILEGLEDNLQIR